MAGGRPPLSPRRKRSLRRGFSRAKSLPEDRVVDDGDDDYGGRLDQEQAGDWTREELEEWADQKPAPATPVVAVLDTAGKGGGWDGIEMGGGPDLPVVTRVLPPGLEVRGGRPFMQNGAEVELGTSLKGGCSSRDCCMMMVFRRLKQAKQCNSFILRSGGSYYGVGPCAMSFTIGVAFFFRPCSIPKT